MTPTDSTGEPHDRLVRAAAQLYAGAPAVFIASRTALIKEAKASGDKESATHIAALRKPSVAAWLTNQVVHAKDPVVTALAEVGTRLRRATSRLDAARLTGMRGERDQVLADLVAAARQMAKQEGQAFTGSLEAEVRDTGIAALADEAAQEIFSSGTMTRALAYAGFGEVDLSEAAATTSTGVVLTSIPGGRKRPAVVDDEPEDDPCGETEDDEPDDGSDTDAPNADNAGIEDSDDDETDVDDGAQALAEAAAAEERARRVAQAELAVEAATREVGARRAAVESARNRGDATRGRLHDFEAKLAQARAEDEDALTKVTEAVSAATQAEADLESARATLGGLTP